MNSPNISSRSFRRPPLKYKTKWIQSRLVNKSQANWPWPLNIRKSLEYHTPRPSPSGEVGVWHNGNFYWVFSVNKRHSGIIWRMYIPHPKNWHRYEFTEPTWVMARAITIPYKDIHMWLHGLDKLEERGPKMDMDGAMHIIRYRDTLIGFAKTNNLKNYSIGKCTYEGYGDEFRMTRRRFYWPIDNPLGFKLLRELIRKQTISGGLLYQGIGDKILEVDNFLTDFEDED